ncbi:PQQ-binding-like beta-propeller repeat protein [Nocardiopsis sp. CA-288880]|uniref:outer membrane protein assembly factor BamB family protein n=1 Tax=Nocardiopsis sp. CA-288880 TaxID=3239995 RepID=UPI003D998DFB
MKKTFLWISGAGACVFILLLGVIFLLPDDAANEGSGAGDGIQHDTAEGDFSEPPVPATVSQVDWTWDAPEGARIGRIHPVPTGAVLQLNDGVVGLNTETGQTAWTYRIPDTDVDVAVSPDGASVVVSVEGRLVVLDSRTGEQKHSLEHGYSDPDSLTLSTAGLVADAGMLTSQEEGGVVIDLTPWSESEEGWRTAALQCPSGENASELDQAFLTEARVILVYACGADEEVMSGIDVTNGEQQWVLPLEGFDYTGRHEFSAVGDIALLENISTDRGTVVIDTENGELISGELPDGLDNDLLRVLPEGYLAVREDQGGGLHYELRDFSNEVQESLFVDPEDAAGSITSFLPMQDSFLKLTFVDGGPDTQISVFDWGGEGSRENIALPIETEVLGLASLQESDAAMGPGSFEVAPGAVILMGYPSAGQIDQIVGMN